MTHSALASTAPDRTPSLDALNLLVKDEMPLVNAAILDTISQDVKMIADIGQHIIASGGKRLRPALTIASAKLCGYTEGTRHVNLAASVELLHTATLLHDDVVDESTMRRGDQTANEIWSNQASVLVGDFLLGKAFQLMVSDDTIEVLRILANASATISQGEVKQLIAANDLRTDLDAYLDVIASKTAALFAAATEIGAVVSNQKAHQEPLRLFGEYLGIAFQLVDDALDYAASQQKLGKTLGDDFREGKITLPVIIAYQEADAEEKIFWERTVSKLDQQDGDFEHAMELILKYDAIRRTADMATEFCQKAEDTIADFADSPAKTALLDALAFCVNRAY